MNDNFKIRHIPASISGRAFSNGILLRGGNVQTIAVRLSDGTIDISASKVKDRKKAKSISAFINMVIVAFSGLKESLKVFKKNKRLSVIRLFKYHGAEHKVIQCYENGDELSVENAKKYSTYHPRCGTNIAANVLIIEALISLIVPAKIRNALCGFVDIILFLAAFFAGFKISRYASRHDNKLAKIFSVPGKLLQRITALEPDEEMLECGIEAAKKVVQSEYR